MTFQAYSQMIIDEAKKQGVNPALALSVAEQESGFNPKAKSPKGAAGIFQLMPSAALDMGIKPSDRYNPNKNIQAGIGFLKKQIDAAGNEKDALARYNFGAGNFESGKPLPKETIDYQNKILNEKMPKYAQYAMNDTGTMTDVPPLPEGYSEITPEQPSSDLPPLPEGYSEAPKTTPLKNIVGGVVEPVSAIASGMLGSAVGGLAGAATLGYDALTGQADPTKAAAVSQGMQEQFTAPPQTPAGQAVLSGIGKGIDIAGQGINRGLAGAGAAGEYLRSGDKQAASTMYHQVADQGIKHFLGEGPQSPEAQTAAYMLPDVATALLPIAKAGKATDVAKQSAEQASSLAGKIGQGVIADTRKVKEAVKSLSNDEVQKIQEAGLTKVLEAKSGGIQQAKQDLLSQDPTTYRGAQLNYTTPNGVQINYVNKALDKLVSHYKSVSDPVAQDFMALKQQMYDKGLTPAQIDKLSSDYREISSAFNKKTGDLAEKKAAIEAENIRKGLKNTARSLVRDDLKDAYKQMDFEQSNLLRTKQLSSEIDEKSAAIMNKLQEKGFKGKAADAVEQIMNLNFGTAVRKGLGGRSGATQLNAKQIQESLPKNVDALHRILNRSKTEAEFLQGVSNLKQNILKSLPAAAVSQEDKQ